MRATVFRKVDSQSTGTLTVEEASTAVVEIWPSFDRQPVFMRSYHAVQVTEAGQIGRKEFRRLLKYVIYFNSNWATFEDIAESTRASGSLGVEEFRTAASRLGVKVTRARSLESHFKALTAGPAGGRNARQGGRIRFDAFCRWCAERHIMDDPEETDAAKAASPQRSHQKSQATPPRKADGGRSSQSVQKTSSETESTRSGGWGRAPPRFSSASTPSDAVTKVRSSLVLQIHLLAILCHLPFLILVLLLCSASNGSHSRRVAACALHKLGTTAARDALIQRNQPRSCAHPGHHQGRPLRLRSTTCARHWTYHPRRLHCHRPRVPTANGHQIEQLCHHLGEDTGCITRQATRKPVIVVQSSDSFQSMATTMPL